ncbi:outer membrane protein assembly factor BamD [Winogradskyella sp. UBA3174]|uniref:outer membrane protein assembly factor BamD n=1 Tax=Winogradskyella sp. UBA3174 TaxID=1947785 RepID=UPI0025F0E111|nr:outer membrane protein assembly factor BamD [Winogradskyella sp. UBA3174]
MKKGLYILLISIIMISCSDFQKTLKAEDTAEKFKLGLELFEAGKWNKAHRLFTQILSNYRGKPQAEKLTFMHAMCSYKMEDYYIASYHFNRFVGSYQNSEKLQEAAFLEAKGYYFLSPIYSKEQKETIEAIEKLQLFVNAYPNSEFLSEANTLVKELDYKLEKKAFEIAKQYDIIKDYKASVNSFNNFLFNFPGTVLREDALYYRLDAEYNLAMKSIIELQQERINTSINYYNTFKKSFPDSEYMEEATRKIEEIKELKNTFNIKS